MELKSRCRTLLLPAQTLPTTSFLVEVTGPRGVGKSTFVGLLKEELTELQLPYNRLAPVSIGDRAVFGLNQLFGRFYTRMLWSQWCPVSIEERRIFQRRLWRYRYRLWRFAKFPGVHIFDEGIYQLMLSLYAKTDQEDVGEISRKLRSMVRFPDLIIFLSASEEAIRLRRGERGNTRDRLKPVISPAGRAAMAVMRTLLEDLPNADGEVVFVESVDRAALQRSAAEAAALIAAKGRSPNNVESRDNQGLVM